MSDISDSVIVSISTAGAPLQQAGFGLPLILSYSAAWTERTREYTTLAGVLADFAATTPEYLQAQAVFGQSPRPPSLVIGRGALKPTQRWAVTPSAVNSHQYTLTVNGTSVNFTADGSATVAEIIAGLKIAIDALALGITTSDQTTYLRVVANAAGAFFSLGTTDPNLRIAQDHADPGVATDLAAIALERNDWFWLLTHFNSQALATAAAAYIEAAAKEYVFQSEDGAIPNTAISGTDDVGEALKALGYTKSAVIYSKATADFIDAGIVGRVASLDPGKYTLKFKALAGVPVGAYTPTQRTNMRAKNVNFYETTGGSGSFEAGVTPAGGFVDYQVYKEFQKSRMQERAYDVLRNVDKLPQNDRGINAIGSEVMGQLQTDEVAEKILPGWTISIPKIGDISDANRAARVLDAIEYSCVYSGAFHTVKINGVITVS